MPSDWIITPRPNPGAAIRLICFADAGGGPAAFDGWDARVPSADVARVQLPGRGSRLHEPPLDSVDAAADAVASAIARGPAAPTVLFGHGLGALIAFETAHLLGPRGWPLLALFASGQRAPSLVRSESALSDLPDAALLGEATRRNGALPDPTFADPELLPKLLPALRADAGMAERYARKLRQPLDCAIHACGGTTDPAASRADLEGWRAETRGRVAVHLFAGDHAYLLRERPAVTSLVANQLTVLLGAMSRWMTVR